MLSVSPWTLPLHPPSSEKAPCSLHTSHTQQHTASAQHRTLASCLCTPCVTSCSDLSAYILAPLPFPQLSPHVRSYRPITPSPCALGQQVIALLSQLIVLPHLMSLSTGS